MNNSILFRMPTAFGAFAKHRTRILVLITTMCVMATGTLTFANTPTGDDYIKFSTTPSLSNSKPLHGSNVSGNIYVHLSDRTINSAMYFLNTNGDLRNSAHFKSMRAFPQALMWKNSDGSPKPFNTDEFLEDGTNTLVVKVRDTRTGKYTTHTANFKKQDVVIAPPVIQPPAPQPPAPQPPAPQPPVVQPPAAFVPAFPGDVAPGFIRWGSGGGNVDPVTNYGPADGNGMGLRRIFIPSWDPAKAVKEAKLDVDAGRLPWVSLKPAGSWQEHGEGKFDDSTRKFFTDLSALNKPVWFTFHHEPEGGGSQGNTPDDRGGAKEWRNAQIKISEILRDLQAQDIAKNVAFGPVLMGYTFQRSSGRTPADWYVPGIWDFAGIDAYARTESTASPILSDGLPLARQFYRGKLKIALGEWAVRTQNVNETVDLREPPSDAEEALVGQRMRAMYNDILASATDGKGAQIIGAAYFDTALNSGATTYELKGTQMSTFKELIWRGTSLRGTQ